MSFHSSTGLWKQRYCFLFLFVSYARTQEEINNMFCVYRSYQKVLRIGEQIGGCHREQGLGLSWSDERWAMRKSVWYWEVREFLKEGHMCSNVCTYAGRRNVSKLELVYERFPKRFHSLSEIMWVVVTFKMYFMVFDSYCSALHCSILLVSKRWKQCRPMQCFLCTSTSQINLN